ncbi:hypothetical protein FD03_GL000888 [Companilactobacillus nodensis DSM 19682 = JCM 14932 = NBRC 107160]|uniref:Bacteriocin immunity protein n=2 Tax=Companilactobacillus nodensis TaxID=460870 RepID=A0A0R1KCG5_9LACO|nr:hypothetical protein [Companilactobacillus nodensis]KRK81295.1 hypothetical protein FD03_GL000888 [Companilactobacillus nodensis DSM 19682 = JCM 14932 = NBRC 107160]
MNEVISSVNTLLGEFNSTFSDSAIEMEIKKKISKAYISINKLESTKEKYNEIPHALIPLDDFLMQAAVSKKYHFSPEQDRIIKEYKHAYSKSHSGSLGAVLNAAALFHP